MPSGAVKAMAKKAGKSPAEAEKLWDKAKEIAKDELNIGETELDDNKSRGYRYAMGVFKSMMESTNSNGTENLLSEGSEWVGLSPRGKLLKRFKTHSAAERWQSVNDENEIVSMSYITGSWGTLEDYQDAMGFNESLQKDLTEAVNIDKVIKDLEKGFGSESDDKMKTLQLIKGLLFSDDKKAKDYIKQLDTATTTISKKLSDTKKDESITETSYAQQRVPYSKEAFKQALDTAYEIDIYRDSNGSFDREWSSDDRTFSTNPNSVIKAVDDMIIKSDVPSSGAQFYIQYSIEESTMNEGSKATKKCPTCGTKYLVQTGYCLKCKKKVGDTDKKSDKKKEQSVNEMSEPNSTDLEYMTQRQQIDLNQFTYNRLDTLSSLYKTHKFNVIKNDIKKLLKASFPIDQENTQAFHNYVLDSGLLYNDYDFNKVRSLLYQKATESIVKKKESTFFESTMGFESFLESQLDEKKDMQYTFGFGGEPEVVEAKYLSPLTKDEKRELTRAIRKAFDSEDIDLSDQQIDNYVMAWRGMDDAKLKFDKFADSMLKEKLSYLDGLVKEVNVDSEGYSDFMQSDEYIGDLFYLVTESNYRDVSIPDEFLSKLREYGIDKADFLQELYSSEDFETGVTSSYSAPKEEGKDIIYGTFPIGEVENQLDDSLSNKLEDLSDTEFEYITGNIEDYMEDRNRDSVYIDLSSYAMYWFTPIKDAESFLKDYIKDMR